MDVGGDIEEEIGVGMEGKRVFFYMFLYLFLFLEFNMLADLPSFFISSVCKVRIKERNSLFCLEFDDLCM